MAGLFPWMPHARWKRWLLIFAASVVTPIGIVLTIVLTAVLLWQNPKNQAWVMVRMLRHQNRQPRDIPPPPHLSGAESALLLTNSSKVQNPGDLFAATNVWDVHLTFTSKQWENLGPSNVAPVLNFFHSDGSVTLRNPEASRNGLAGVFGFEFPWSTADLRFGDSRYREVGARYKGNGTFVDSQRSYKRPLKVDLDRNSSQQLAGITTLNLHNLVADASCLRDTLAYEFYRQAGVPAPRTGFARLRLSIQGRFEDRLLGLYVLVENPDGQWARGQFGTAGVALFKPVTYELFKDLGSEWESYARIYDAKTKIKPKQSGRLIALAKLATHASDAEFAQQIGQFIDLEEFARFLACEVMLSNYDGFLSNGQNFLLYLDPRTEKFGFIPWDLDHSWGEFGFIGTLEQREQASLWHPWVGSNRFLERMLAAPAVREVYRNELQRLRASLFIPDRLNHRLEELAAVVRPFIAEESEMRLRRFDREVGDDQRAQHPRAYTLKHFFVARAAAISEQIDGSSSGVIVTRRPAR